MSKDINMSNIVTDIDLNKFLIGVFNSEEKGDQATQKLIGCIKAFGLRQIIKEPTRYSRANNSCLDLFIKDSNAISNVGVCDINLSDHLLILFTRRKASNIKKKCELTGRSYRNYNPNKQIYVLATLCHVGFRLRRRWELTWKRRKSVDSQKRFTDVVHNVEMDNHTTKIQP